TPSPPGLSGPGGELLRPARRSSAMPPLLFRLKSRSVSATVSVEKTGRTALFQKSIPHSGRHSSRSRPRRYLLDRARALAPPGLPLLPTHTVWRVEMLSWFGNQSVNRKLGLGFGIV